MWFRMAMSQLTDYFINTFGFIKDNFINLTALYNFYATSEVDEASLHKA